ncbi:MAG: HAMP domain-containing protein [Synergistaceae bacterium]|jgi:two-component system sensor histidine kinase CpxA|nr:HAMP domain-containing protein [Synergistaceae bacterium]
MKKIVRFSLFRFSLFWKIYLTLLLVLVLPIILFSLSHIIRDRDMPRDMSRVVRHLEWSASELAGQAEAIVPEGLVSWLEGVKAASGLTVCIQRNGKSFHLPGSEWLDSYESNKPNDPKGEEFPFGPPVVSSFSPSGRTKAIVATSPFRGKDGGNAPPGPRKRNSWVFLVVAVLCVAFSFMLVRNFMSPLQELRGTTLKLAGGDLSVRVGQGVTGRSDEIADLGRIFNRMAERVETLVSSQKRLLSDISHEIRSPLQRMEVASALLRDRLPADIPKYVERIELEISRIDEMVEELLTLVRAEETSPVRTEVVELDKILDSVIADAEFEERSANEKGMAGKIVTSGLEKLPVMGDATLLSRALRNVIHNATRYTAPGTEVEVNAFRDGAYAVVTVRDHGQGVSEKDLDKIFLPYYRTDEARERSRGGVGLGLGITKRILESHGGDVAAFNIPVRDAPASSGGLLVTVRLPLESTM